MRGGGQAAADVGASALEVRGGGGLGQRSGQRAGTPGGTFGLQGWVGQGGSRGRAPDSYGPITWAMPNVGRWEGRGPTYTHTHQSQAFLLAWGRLDLEEEGT